MDFHSQGPEALSLPCSYNIAVVEIVPFTIISEAGNIKIYSDEYLEFQLFIFLLSMY